MKACTLGLTGLGAASLKSGLLGALEAVSLELLIWWIWRLRSILVLDWVASSGSRGWGPRGRAEFD